MADPEASVARFEAMGDADGKIKPLKPFDIAVLTFRDLDKETQ